MTTPEDDLVARARDRSNYQPSREDMWTLADRIEALERKNAELRQYRRALRTVFFLEHNEREWNSLEECQEWARRECLRIDNAIDATRKG